MHNPLLLTQRTCACVVAGLVYIFSTKSTYVFINFIGIFNTFLSHGAVLCVYVCV